MDAWCAVPGAEVQKDRRNGNDTHGWRARRRGHPWGNNRQPATGRGLRCIFEGAQVENLLSMMAQVGNLLSMMAQVGNLLSMMAQVGKLLSMMAQVGKLRAGAGPGRYGQRAKARAGPPTICW